MDRANSYCKCETEGDINFNRLQIIHENVLDVDFSEASVLFIYLVPAGMKAIRYVCMLRGIFFLYTSPAYVKSSCLWDLYYRDKLIDLLEKGCRIVTYIFSIPEVTAERVELFKSSTKIYFYRKSTTSSSSLNVTAKAEVAVKADSNSDADSGDT